MATRRISDLDTVNPTDWSKIIVTNDSVFSGNITAATNTFSGNLPGELLDYTIKYDMDWIRASGWIEQDLHDHLKKELAAKMAQQMMDNGHIEFTKQTDLADNSVRFKAYTWVGNKDFIEQQRKKKP